MTEQKEIQLYNDIYRYLKDSEYRPNATKNDKRAIRRRTCSFVLRDGLLYFTEDGADSTAKQWIVDKESQMKVITSCHDQKLGGGHFGRDKTLQKICSHFYWRDMTKHIKEPQCYIRFPLRPKSGIKLGSILLALLNLHAEEIDISLHALTIFPSGQRLKPFQQNQLKK
ncbi:hypothetical protein EMCRGX_G013457 [Ephydatia muelleri]